jgi:hypothetical protein
MCHVHLQPAIPLHGDAARLDDYSCGRRFQQHALGRSSLSPPEPPLSTSFIQRQSTAASINMAATAAPIGFDFSNYARNEFVGARLGAEPKSELAVLD